MRSDEEDESETILPLKKGRPSKLPANSDWTEYKIEDLKVLVGLVYENDVLWNSKNSQNYRKETTNPIWHEIEKRLFFLKNDGHKYGGTIRKVWAQLLAKFKYYYKRVNCPPSGSAVVDLGEIKKAFPLYDDMLFIEQNLDQRSVTTTWLSSSPLNDCQSTSEKTDSKIHRISPNSPKTPSTSSSSSTPKSTSSREPYRGKEFKKKESAHDRLFALVERNSQMNSELIKQFMESEKNERSKEKEKEAMIQDPLMDTIVLVKGIHEELDDFDKISFRSKLTVTAIELRDKFLMKKGKSIYQDPLLADIDFTF